jgi:tetrahydromethanopterin S-methyltransferase subunit B
MVLMLNRIQIASKQYQNHVKITSTSSNDKTIDQTKLSRNSIFFETNPPEPPPNKIRKLNQINQHQISSNHRGNTVLTSYPNRIKTKSKSDQNHQAVENSTKTCPGAVFVSFLGTNTSGTLKKICSQTILKPGQNSHPKQ